MRSNRYLCMLLAIVVFMGIMPAHAADGQTNAPDSAWELAGELNVGWNLGNTLEIQNLNYGYLAENHFDMIEALLGNPVTEESLIRAVADRGFSSIRIPVSFYNHLLESRPKSADGTVNPGKTIDPAWLERVARVVDWALDAGMYVILNDHHDTSMWMNVSWIYAEADEAEEQTALLMNIWKQYAEYFKNYDHRVIFQSTGEIVNRDRSFSASDHDDMRAAHDLNQAFIETVRSTGGKNADRFLMLPTYAANSGTLFVDESFYVPYRDTARDKLLFSVHNYSTDSEEMERTFEMLYARALKYGVPFVVDECGAMLTEDMDTRLRVSYKLTNLAEKFGMAVMVWDGGSAEHGYIDRKKTIETGKIAYVTEWTYQGATYRTDSERVVEALFRGKAEAKPVTPEEKARITDESVKAVDFVFLNRGNRDKVTEFGRYFTYGTYSQIDAGATIPVSLYIPVPKNYACIYPYFNAEGSSFRAILPVGITITIRELDRDGKFIRNKYVTAAGGRYVPSSDAVYAAVCIRSQNAGVSFGDYLNWVAEGALEIYPLAGEPYKLDSISVAEPPDKTGYTEGESFNRKGMKIIAKYSDGSQRKVEDYTVEPSGALSLSDTGVKISYTEGGVTVTATQSITVQPYSVSYTLTYRSNGGSAVPPSLHAAGSTVALTAEPVREGFDFTGWYADAGLGKRIFSVVMNGDMTVYAGWEKSKHNCPSKHLKDVDKNAWYHEYVDNVVEKGLMIGTAKDRFSPDIACSRAMIVAVLYRLEGKPAVSDGAGFSDAAAGQWYTDAIVWAHKAGIVVGHGDGRFGTNDPITREEMAAILFRYARHKGYDTGKRADLSGYSDAYSISSWALASMRWANAEGVIAGRSAAILAPKGHLTRAEFAAMLTRFINRIR